MKFDRYTIVGLLCALPYLVFGVALTAPKAANIVGYLVLTIALTGAEVAFFDMILSNRRKNWLYRVPFSALFTLVQLMFGWNVMIPFYIMGQFAVGAATTRERVQHMPRKKAAKPLWIAAGASLLFLTVALVTGVKA